MEFYMDQEGNYVLQVDEAALVMSREEAEILFVDIGRTLQNADVVKEAREGLEEQGED